MNIDATTHQSIPKQKIANSKKNKKWGESCVDAYIGLSDMGGFGNRRQDVQSLYDFYNGHILEEDYHYVLKPYGKARNNLSMYYMSASYIDGIVPNPSSSV